MTRSLVLALSLALAPSLPAQDAARAPLTLPRLGAAITVDGVPDEAAWQDVAPLPLTMYAPVFRGTPTQRTILRVAHDEEYLYAAGWMFDSDPRGIRVNSLYRDRWAGDDALAIYVDAQDDNMNARWFGLTAGGVRFDQLVSDDGSTLNADWDAFWSAATTLTPEGWFAEVRIPFSTLGVRPDANGRVRIGLTITRLVSRLGERVTFPAIEPKFEFRRPSVAQDMVLDGVRSRAPLYVTPYALAGASATSTPPTSTVPRWGTHRATERDLGLDVRYVPGDVTLDFTINTDFAQAEADEQQVNLDRFPLFFPERRRFFQEGSNVFDFAAGTGARLFHSRRIGLAPDGSPVPIVGGARLVGRLGDWDTGVLGMRTREDGTTPGESFGVLRMRRPMFNRYSSAGFMATGYEGGGERNVALGVDGTVRVFGDHYVVAQLSGTDDTRDTSAASVVDRSLAYLRWERRSQRGLGYQVSTSHMGPDYRPEIGFVPRRDFTTLNAVGNYFIYTDQHPWMRRYYPGALAFHTIRNSDGKLESAQWAFWVEWDSKAGGTMWLEPKWFHEDVANGFAIGKVQIPRGSYDFMDFQVAGAMAAGRRVRTGMDFRTGTFYDGRRTQLVLTPTWNVSPHLELGGDYQVSHLTFRARDQEETVHLARLRVRTALDARASGNAFVQYNSIADRLDVNVRLRYQFAEGTDFWLVYNAGLDTERSHDSLLPVEPRMLARTVLLKYSHTLALF